MLQSNRRKKAAVSVNSPRRTLHSRYRTCHRRVLIVSIVIVPARQTHTPRTISQMSPRSDFSATYFTSTSSFGGMMCSRK